MQCALQHPRAAETACALRFALVVIAIFLRIAIYGATAQAQAQPAESPQAKQLHEAMRIARQGNVPDAMALAEALLKEHPTYEPALKFQGMILEQTGHAAEAAASYEKALALAPNDPDLLYSVGVHALVTGERDRAIQLLVHHVKLAPKDGDALFYLAQAYHLNGNDSLALKTLEQCVRLEPENATALQKFGELLSSSGDYATGLKWLLKADRLDATLAHIDYDIGTAELKLMDLRSAVQYAGRAVEVHPDDLNGLELLATAQVKSADWQSAKGTFERILVLKADDVDSLLGLGQCEVELKSNQAAVETLSHVLQLDPTRLTAHFYLSRAYAGLGNSAEAQHQAALHHLMMEQVSFVRSIETEQRESAITAQARQMLRDQQEEEALQLYRDHFKGTSATTADAYVFVGKLNLFMGHTEEGLRELHHAIELAPTVRGAHTYEGILALKFGDLSKAESEFNAELANDPNSQMAIAEMGEVRYHQGRWADAAELLAKSRTTTPDLLYLLCDSYFHLGKVSDADLTAETLAAYGRNKPALMQGLVELLKTNGQTELAQSISANFTSGAG